MVYRRQADEPGKCRGGLQTRPADASWFQIINIGISFPQVNL
jgi:hypothetical protein